MSNISTTEKSDNKQFNLFRYVYGQMFLNALLTSRSSIIIEKKKYYSWKNIINWLETNKYIQCLQVQDFDSQQVRINYVFNQQDLMYKPYLKYLARMTGSRTIKIA